MTQNVLNRLKSRWAEGKFICLGIDPEVSIVPQNQINHFTTRIVDATKSVVCAYKFNLAHFLQHGADGIISLGLCVLYARQTAPDVPIIFDFKGADIGSSSSAYANFAFKHLEVDAVTVSPHLGQPDLAPFLSHKDKLVFVLCRTSNPGAKEFQDLSVDIDREELQHLQNVEVDWSDGPCGARTKQYTHIAYQVSKFWNEHGNCGLIAGGLTHELQGIRRTAGDLPILVLGTGAGMVNISDLLSATMDSQKQGLLINTSSGIGISPDYDDFAETAHDEIEGLNVQIRAILGM